MNINEVAYTYFSTYITKQNYRVYTDLKLTNRLTM